MYVCVYICICVYIYICMYVCIYMYMHVCMYIFDLYLSVFLRSTVSVLFSVSLYAPGSKRVTQFQIICMYVRGRIDNKADFDLISVKHRVIQGNVTVFTTTIYIYAFSRRFYPKRLIQAIHFLSVCVFPGN